MSRQHVPMNASFPSPYNFVPASEDVVFPNWGNAASHDIPFRDGVCGHLDIEIDALTPLICRGGRGKDGTDEFFTDARGRPAIPGTSLRGMLRSVVEIASFSKLAPVNTHRYGIRDLQNRYTYLQYMAELQRDPRTGKNEPVPLVDAGWLRKCEESDDGRERWVIEPCHFAKVEYASIERVANAVDRPKYRPGPRRGAAEKYREWVGLDSKSREPLSAAHWAFLEQAFDCKVAVKARRGTQSKTGVTRLGDFGEVSMRGAGQSYRGRLVFTGQPQAWVSGARNKKHHDFFFYGTAGAAIEVPRDVAEAFELVHQNSGQQGRDSIDPNAEWGFWKPRLDLGGKVPVFFLRRADGELRAFGLAMMFRLAYDLSTGDVATNAQPLRLDPRPDLAECIFGFVRDNRRAADSEGGVDRGALRGRVSIGQGRPVREPATGSPFTAVLGAPKPTFYPAYIVQGGAPGSRPSTGDPTPWTTYMNDGAAPRARGWKRYLSRRCEIAHPPLPPKSGEKVKSRLRPVPAKTRFRARLRVHNLRTVELGALLWALDFGGTRDACHSLGQARAFGYGMVRISLCDGPHGLRAIDGIDDVDLDHARRAFRAYMHAQITGWDLTPQIVELVAMATPPTDPEREKLMRYPDLGAREFDTIKKNALALPLHGGEDARRRRAECVDPVRSVDIDEAFPDLRPKRPSTAPEPMKIDPPSSRPVPPAPEPTVPRKPPKTEPPKRPPHGPFAPSVLPDWIEVRFADVLRARTVRKKHTDRAKKRKPQKDVELPLVSVDAELATNPALAAIALHTVATKGAEEIFEALRVSSQAISFFVRAIDGRVVEARVEPDHG